MAKLRSSLVILMFLACIIVPSVGDQRQDTVFQGDTVYQKNGEVIAGTIVEDNPGSSLKIRVGPHSVWLLYYANIQRIVQQRANAQNWDKRVFADYGDVVRLMLVEDRSVLKHAKMVIRNVEINNRTALKTVALYSIQIQQSLITLDQYLTMIESTRNIHFVNSELLILASLHNHYLAALEEQHAIAAELGQPEPKRSVLYRGATYLCSEMQIVVQKDIELLKRADIPEQEKLAGARAAHVSLEAKTR